MNKFLYNTNDDVEKIVIDGYEVPHDRSLIVMLPKYYHIPNIHTKDIIYLSMVDIWGMENADTICSELFSKVAIARMKRRLHKRGLLSGKPTITPQELKKISIEKSHNGDKCEWCGEECYILHEHHYPIPERLGGTQTVRICPNCHYTYHLLCKNYEILY
jgi:hypothetical protein